MQHPVGVQVLNAVQDLVQQRLHHPPRDHHRLLVGLGRPVVFDDVLVAMGALISYWTAEVPYQILMSVVLRFYIDDTFLYGRI